MLEDTMEGLGDEEELEEEVQVKYREVLYSECHLTIFTPGRG